MKLQFVVLGIILVASLSYLSSCSNDNLVDLSKSINTSKVDTVTTSASNTSSGTSSNGTIGSTTTVSFTNQIKPILVKYNCAGCHGSYYTTYQGASTWAKSGLLYGTMSGSPGYRKMPPSQSVSVGELNLISTWIKEGATNN